MANGCMCGISCFAGENAVEKALVGLRALSYRGYDSFGFAAKTARGIIVRKAVGKVGDFELGNSPNSGLCISHTRWATHGAVTEKNSHPHVSCDKRIAVVHNGIIENFAALRSGLEAKGHCFGSETDTEVIPHLIEDFLRQGNSIVLSFRKALGLLEGKFAVAALFADSEKIFCATNSPPLIIGLGKSGNFIASDASSFLKQTNRAVFLSENQLACVSPQAIEVFDTVSLKKIEPKVEYLDWNFSAPEKGEFEHFMLKEIFEQPRAVERTIRAFSRGSLNEKTWRKAFAGINRIIFVACGTSYYAGLLGESFFEKLACINTEVEYASEFACKRQLLSKRDLVVAISQSGETADTIEAVKIARKSGASVLSLVNVEKSSIAKESDFLLPIMAGIEVGVASTKAFTCFVAALFALSVFLAKEREKISEAEEKALLRELGDMPKKMEAVLSCSLGIQEIALKFSGSRNALFLGRGQSYPVALEGALKLKEISYIHAEGYPAAEMKHGPIALIDSDMPVFFIAPNDSLFPKLVSNMQEVRARNGKIISIATEKNPGIWQYSDAVIFVPETNELLSPLLSILPLQLIAYYIAGARGCSIDKPRNLAKSVTVG